MHALMHVCSVLADWHLFMLAWRNHDAWFAAATQCAAAQVYKWDPDREEKPSYKSYNIDINRCELAGLGSDLLS